MTNPTPKTEWIVPKRIEDMPPKPGLASYEYVDCLVLHCGELLHRPWNCEHQCFDDEAHDDWFCDWIDIQAYRVIDHELGEARRAMEAANG